MTSDIPDECEQLLTYLCMGLEPPEALVRYLVVDENIPIGEIKEASWCEGIIESAVNNIENQPFSSSREEYAEEYWRTLLREIDDE